MTDQIKTLEHAAALLRGEPWRWAVTIEYPGFISIAFDNGDGTRRYYAAGFANQTLTIDLTSEDDDGSGASADSVDTGIAVANLDGYSFAIQTAAAIDRMEHGR